MEQKRGILISIIMFAMILVLTLSVYATNGTISTGTSGPSDVCSIVLPTTGADFVIDPYGLSTVGVSGKTLQEVMDNPPGLVTSGALTVENKNAAGVLVKAEVYLETQWDISLASKKEDAEKGNADLYLEILPTGVSAGYPSTAITVLEDGTGYEGNKFSFFLNKKGDENSTYAFRVDGYANPNAQIWKDINSASVQEPIKLCMKFTFEPEDVDDSSESETDTSETESESETDPSSSESSSSESDSSETESSKPDETTSGTSAPTDVNYVDGAFDLIIPKAQVSSSPTDIYMIFNSKYYDLKQYSLVKITEEGDNYKISVKYFQGAAARGTCQLAVYSGDELIYDQATITIPIQN